MANFTCPFALASTLAAASLSHSVASITIFSARALSFLLLA